MTVKFLIIRFSSIGDIVLTTPIVRCLKKQVEGAEIHYLTKPAYASVLQGNPYIDRIILLQPSIRDTIRELKEEGYDYVIDLHNSIRSWRVKSALPWLSFSVKKLNREKWLMVHFKINKLPSRHIVDRYLDTVKLFDVENDGEGLDFFLSPEDEVPLSQLPKYLHSYIAVAMGARHVTKQIPPEKIAGLCRQFTRPVLLLGDRFDIENAEKVVDMAGGNVYNACGKFSLRQSAWLVRQSLAVVTPDTGLMHIASAFKKNVISVWGNTIPEFGMYPYLPGEKSRLFEVKGLSCRPCSKLGYPSCPKKHFRCMMDIDYKELADYVNRITG
ncbi:MAG TPA: glycosyltransferase family 9 protein [Bacteroidales bacterium]|mgnify:FL=1|nr:glycosyltransferase family 9 protein [Bacteroidales bacterium]